MKSKLKMPTPILVAAIAVVLAVAVSAIAVESHDGNISRAPSINVILLIAYVSLALVFSFLCSIAEAVLLSITPSYIEGEREKRPGRAALLQRLKHDNIDRSLAAILTLNTIAHTVGAIGAGAQASLVFGSTWFGVFSAVMTLLILFLSEIVPKTIGALHWSKLVRPTAYFVQFLVICLFPIVWISERLTKIISHGKNLHIFSRDEFIAMARIGVQTGTIRDNESQIIRNLLQLRSLTVSDVMTPSTVISSLPEDMKVADAVEKIAKIPFSRLPLYGTSHADINGFVLRTDILLKHARGESDDCLRSLKRDINVVPLSISVSILLERFLKERQHIALVVDEHGGTRGLVTLEDLIETLIGVEIMDEVDKIEDMRVLARKLWLDRARALGLDEEITVPNEGKNL